MLAAPYLRVVTHQSTTRSDEMISPVLMTVREAARFLRISESCLNKWRLTGEGPPFIKLGAAVRYRRRDVEAWIDEQTRTSTSATLH